jgi:uncharacterized metal-binding protein YceD (DUF177 family)
MQKHDKIGAKINLMKLPLNTGLEFELDQETDWVREILRELNENATEKKPEAYLQETSLLIRGTITRKQKPDLQEYVTIKGTIEADYATECIRTLRPMTMQLDVAFKVAFIDEALSETELFKDIDETYIDNEVMDVYFYNNRTIEFQEMLHEQVFLNYEQYPVLDADCKLDGVETPEAP